MVVRLNTNPVQQPGASMQTQGNTPCQKNTHYHSTLVSSNENRMTQYFRKAWDIAKWIFSSAWSWSVWLFRGCPVETSKLDILEDIMEAPIEKGKEFSKKPKETIGELVGAVLDNPTAFKDLIESEGNKEKFEDFIKAFKENIKDYKKTSAKQRNKIV